MEFSIGAAVMGAIIGIIVLALPLCDRNQSNFDVRVHSLI